MVYTGIPHLDIERLRTHLLHKQPYPLLLRVVVHIYTLYTHCYLQSSSITVMVATPGLTSLIPDERYVMFCSIVSVTNSFPSTSLSLVVDAMKQNSWVAESSIKDVTLMFTSSSGNDSCVHAHTYCTLGQAAHNYNLNVSYS